MQNFPLKINVTLLAFFIVFITFGALTFKVSAQSAYENKVFSLINSERQKIGLSALNFNAKLYQAARTHNDLMNKCASTYGKESCFKHQVTLLGEATLMDRIKATGYSPTSVGEIIGWGYKTPETMVAGWMGSSGHKANILTTARVDLGCGYLDAGGGDYRKIWWTCDFGKSSSQVASAVSPTATPKPTPSSTATPRPTLTPAPTGAPTPTSRPSNTPTPTNIISSKPWWCAFFPTMSYCQ